MPPASQPIVYLLLGATGSGRRDVLVDLIEAGLTAADRPAVMLAAGEPADPSDARLPNLTHWEWRDDVIVGRIPAGATHVFFVADGRLNPVNQVEVFKPWLEAQGGALARVLTVVNTRLVEQNPTLIAWFDACVHFSDVTLLNRREGVENKWLSTFLGHYRDQFIPCIFEMVKEGRVKNPPLILEPQARRMSHYFDEEQDWVFTNTDGEVVDEEDEESSSDDDEIEAKPAEDPYFERLNGGRRVKQIPDIAKFLPPAA
jgi:hypothetical protein